jgi:hypothetical protein
MGLKSFLLWKGDWHALGFMMCGVGNNDNPEETYLQKSSSGLFFDLKVISGFVYDQHEADHFF